MNTPNSQNNAQAAQVTANQAVDANSGSTVQTVDTFNNLSSTNEVTATFTADNQSGTAAGTDVYILPGVGVGANKTLGTGITYSGDFASYADFIDYFTHVPMLISYIRVQTSNTANYSSRLTIQENKPNLRSPQYKDLQMTNYRISTGNGYSDTLTITNDIKGTTIWPNFSMVFKGLLKNSSISFYIGISSWARTYAMSGVSF